MKKNIGTVVGLYPTPVTIVGTIIDGKVNWINIAHIGLVGKDAMMISMRKEHESNRGIKGNKTLSINLVNKDILVEADYVGMVSAEEKDKSDVFDYFTGELNGAPLISNAPVVMECEVVDVYETETHNNYIVKTVNTYAEDNVLTDGKIDYEKVQPVLFEMPNRMYLSTGKVIGKSWSLGKQFQKV